MNGHPDRTLQINYLGKATIFLSKFRNVRYLTYDEHQSLAKCWNQLIILSCSENILIMNDDTQAVELFREQLESKIMSSDLPFTTINNSWSHFFISKPTIKRVGWFDERFLGIGCEDADMMLRLVMMGFPIYNTACLGVTNYVADEKDSGWKNISEKHSTSKYSERNYQFFKTKWYHDHVEPFYKNWEYSFTWNGVDFKFSSKTSEIMPNFYEMSVLDKLDEALVGVPIYRENRVVVLIQKLYFLSRKRAASVYKSIISCKSRVKI